MIQFSAYFQTIQYSSFISHQFYVLHKNYIRSEFICAVSFDRNDDFPDNFHNKLKLALESEHIDPFYRIVLNQFILAKGYFISMFTLNGLHYYLVSM